MDSFLNDLKEACNAYNAIHHKDIRAQRITRLHAEAQEEKVQLLAVMQNDLYDDTAMTRSWEEAIAFQRAGVTPTAKARVGNVLQDSNLKKGLEILGGGQVATVYEGTWEDRTTHALYTGVYKRETSKVENDPDSANSAYYVHESHGGKLGIPFEHPNYGARNIAMYKVCQLLGVNVIPQTEFALHKGDLGYVMTKIVGSTIVKKQLVEVDKNLPKLKQNVKDTLKKAQKGDQEAQVMVKKQGYKKVKKGKYSTYGQKEEPTVSLTQYGDPVVQKDMTNLQLIDAICRSTDRNQENYLLEFDQHGNIVGVEGIDNDFSFGDTYFKNLDVLKGFMAHCGLPPVVDKQMFAKVMQTDDEAVMNAVRGILPEAEVKVLVDQYSRVRYALKSMAQNQIIETWGQESLQQLQAAGAESSYFMRDYSLIKGYESNG